MPQIKLSIADNDRLFLDKFAAYLQNYKNIGFSLELFTNKSNLQAWLDNDGKADLILISSSLFSQMGNKPENKNVVILNDSPGSFLPQEYNVIEKYQPAEKLVKEILHYCSESIPSALYKNQDSGITHLVLYADGSDLLNPLAQSIAVIKSQLGNSAFYLSLDEIPVTDTWFSGLNEKGLSEMLYYIKSKKGNLYLKLESCTSRDAEYGIDFLKSHINPLDISEMSACDCSTLIGAVRERSIYRDIIISRAWRFDELTALLIKEAHKVYITALNFPSSLKRLNIIANYFISIKNEEGYDIKDKLLFLITSMTGSNETCSLDISDYSRAFLPFPYMDNETALKPKQQYMLELRNIIENFSVYE